MIMSWVALLGGLIFLTLGADRFVLGASATARNLGVSPLIIGMTIMGIGTSAPEMLVSVMAALEGNPQLATGNAVGSNIANIGLVLGATALIAPLTVHSRTLQREYPLLGIVTLLGIALLWDTQLALWEGWLLIIGCAALIVWMVYTGTQGRRRDPLISEYEAEIPRDMPMTLAVVWTLAGLLVLIISSRALTWGAVNIARDLGISDLVIGLTIVAVGTSLPELAASVASALKKEHDMAIGNIIGSNMFNMLAVLGLSSIFGGYPIEHRILTRDLPVMVVLTILLWLYSYGFRGPGRINRLEAGSFLGLWGGYMLWLYFSANPG